ncbi:MAG TPA: bifunctional DNA primase/polymerase [Bradyrhizobium sp.]|nr:bifunctional DNA primase/polymerase [Bradyrhizobium sp.]
MNYGACPDDWIHLALTLGLTADLMPVVSNPSAKISPESKMTALGKTPSRYNSRRQVAGLTRWTSRITTPAEIERWAKEGDYGICIQTRSTRGLDLDITDAGLVVRVGAIVENHMGRLPTRIRSNSSKCLLAFLLPGDYTKRVIRTKHGIIEFLATGQQFVGCGMHPSGARYEWEGGLPKEIPTVLPDQFEALWSALQSEFGIADSTERKPSITSQVRLEAHMADPIAARLFERGMVLSREKAGELNITCPFADEHTSGSGESATRYWPAHTGGFTHGNFLCLHAHCVDRKRHEYLERLGLDERAEEDFTALPVGGEPLPGGEKPATEAAGPAPSRFTPIPLHEFAVPRKGRYLIKHVCVFRSMVNSQFG